MKSINKFLAGQDQLGPPIRLNFKGSDRWQTARGGVITIAMYMIFLWQALYLCKKFVRREDSEISSYSLIEGD